MTRSLMISKRTLLYLLWYLFVLALASFVFDVIWGNNSQGDSCNVALWKYGELYQAVDERPCVFTNEFYFAAYILLWRISEIGVVFIIYWLGNVYKWSDFVMVYTSLLGSLQFLWPFFVVAIVVKYIRPNVVLYLLRLIILRKHVR